MRSNFMKRTLIAMGGVVLVGIGIAFTNGASLGNDPVGILYDGIRVALNLTYEQLNSASALVNFVLAAIVFCSGRKYVNLGTLIYILPNGLCVWFGTMLFKALPFAELLIMRVLTCIVGCGCMYLGVALFIVADIGLDPFTGCGMVIADKLRKDFRVGKWIMDGIITLIGFALGGTFGVVTAITILISGSIIQFFRNNIARMFLRMSIH